MRTQIVCWLIIVAYTTITANGNNTFPVSNHNEWWSNTIIYQVYPRSFKDSNNDGIGDLKGIIQKLDHFVDIGVETLWVGPIFKSPMDDLGYDVEDYYTIDPIFGTMDDFKELVSETNKRNLKLITDIVPNHSSYKSEWFQKSIRREGKYKDYYIWRDAKNQKDVLSNPSVTPIVPNNWLSVFGGTAWTWHTERKQFYYHQFNPKQPDYNIRNPEVQKEIYDILEFWLDKGIVGFRFDALKHLFEDDKFLDEEFLPGKENSTNHDDMNHTYTCDQPETFDMIYKWREFLDNYTTTHNLPLVRLMTTESYSEFEVLMKYYGNSTKLGAQIPYNFGLLIYKRDKLSEGLDMAVGDWLKGIPKNMVPNWDIENHDNKRIPTYLGHQMVQVLNALKLILPGVDVTYYGGEIGMENTYVRPDQAQDPNNGGGVKSSENRDAQRCPMQWDDTINAGFTGAKTPWLPVNPNYYKLNVEAQKKNPTSNLNFYKKMVKLRKTDTLKYGDLQTYNISKPLYIVKRSLPEHESYIAVINVGSETETLHLSSVFNNLNEKPLYVYLGSENSIYSQGHIVSTNGLAESLLELRPNSVIVLTDKVIKEESTQSSGSCGKKTGSLLFVLLSVILLTKNIL